MENFIARPSLWRMAMLLTGAVAFVAIGAWIAGLLGKNYPHGREALGWACMAFFALCVVIAAKRLFENEDVLRMDRQGLWYRYWSTDTIPWAEITKVGVWEYRRQRSIVVTLKDPARFPSTTVLGKLAAANRALTGGDITIGLTGTDRTFDEALAEITRRAAHAARPAYA